MKYDPKIHHRTSIRLKNYDYSQAGLYFVTICTQNRECLLGEIIDDEMVLNVAGRMINQIWLDIPNQHDNTNLHEYIVMPNHFHGIIEIVGAPLVGAQIDINNQPQTGRSQTGQPQGIAPTVGNIVGAFKSITTNEYIRGVKNKNWPRFDNKLWQRNYWEHIVRNENEYHRISDYIKNNPASWCDDKLNDGIGNQEMQPKVEYNTEAWMV